VSDELLLVVEASFVVTKRGLVVLPPIETRRSPSTISRAIVARVEHARTLEAVISLEHF
jgi:hypothetical protein